MLPLTYYNARGSYALTWTNGRQLASVTKNGVTTTYTYNKDGIRTSKTVNGVSYGMYFTYDEKGMPFTMEYREGDRSYSLYWFCVPKIY